MPDDWKRWWKFAKEDQNMGFDNLEVETFAKLQIEQMNQSEVPNE